MKAKYLGLDLSSPVVVSSSPYTATVSNIEQCVRNGAGAVVLKSIFEEQIYRQAASLDRMEGYGDAGEYLERYLGEAYKAELLELVSDAAKTGIPVIGSINCAGAGDAWIEYAAAMQQAGAAALERIIFLLPTDRRAAVPAGRRPALPPPDTPPASGQTEACPALLRCAPPTRSRGGRPAASPPLRWPRR